MAVRSIRIWPDPALSEVAKPVAQVDDKIGTLLADLFETMYQSKVIGLAANQVGVTGRVLVIDRDPKTSAKSDPDIREELEGWGYTGPTAFITPEIISAEGSIV